MNYSIKLELRDGRGYLKMSLDACTEFHVEILGKGSPKSEGSVVDSNI